MNILIADDVQGWVDFHKKNLLEIYKDKEINIYSFNSAHEAYDFAFTFNDDIDLVITDLQMESMEMLAGEWLTINLKTTKATENAKFILISSCYNIGDISQKVNAEGFCRKPSYYNNPGMLKYKLEELFGEKL